MDVLLAADEVLAVCCAIGVWEIRWDAAEAGLNALDARGLAERCEREAHDSDGEVAVTGSVVLDRVLAEVLAPHSIKLLSVPAAPVPGFQELTSADLPEGCCLYFQHDPRQPAYSVRGVRTDKACVVVHVDDALDEDAQESFRGLAVEVVRLGELAPALKSGELWARAQAIRATHCAAQGDQALDASAVEKRRTTRRDADPTLLVQYASTADDQAFEAAVAKVLCPVMDLLVPLGGGFTGKPFPDGLVARLPSQTQACEVAIYDCKSKLSDEYAFPSKDGDQLARYTRVSDRLKVSEGWCPRGVIIFTTDTDPGDLLQKASKDPWRQLTDEGRKLVIWPAGVLARLHELIEREESGFLGSFFSPARFWNALWDRRIEGLTEAVSQEMFSMPGPSTVVLDRADAEVLWLAGLAGEHREVNAIAEALDQTDLSRPSAGRVRRGALIRGFHEALRDVEPTVASIASHVGLETTAVRCLLRCPRHHPRGAAEFGARGVANLDRLNREVGGAGVGA